MPNEIMTVEEAIELLKDKRMEINYKVNGTTQFSEALNMATKALERELILDKVRAEIMDCLKALDEIEKSGVNIYLPNEISGRRLTYRQCLKIIDKYKAESEGKDETDN